MRPEQLLDAFERMFDPLAGKRRRRGKLVASGLPLFRVFFSTRPLKATNVEASPKILLHEVLQSPNSNVDDMAVNMLQGSPAKRPVVSLVSCQKKYIAGILARFQECGIRPFQIEPAACALLRIAEMRHRSPRKAKTVLRLFLGESDRGLAVLLTSGWPLMPRSFVVETDLNATVTSNVRTFDVWKTVWRGFGDRRRAHPRPAGIARVDRRGCAREAARRANPVARRSGTRQRINRLRHRGRLPEDELAGLRSGALDEAAAIAVGIVSLERSGVADSGRRLSRSVSLASQPRFEHAAGRRALGDQRAPLADVAIRSAGRERETGARSSALDAVRKFLSTRVLWTAYAHDIPAQLPENATLNSFYGVCGAREKREEGHRHQGQEIVHDADRRTDRPGRGGTQGG